MGPIDTVRSPPAAGRISVAVFHAATATVAAVTTRLAVAVALVVVLVALAWWIERRRPREAPTQPAVSAPAQLDRRDFARPDAPWLVVLFTSRTCESCEGLYEKASPLISDDVAVVEVEYSRARAMHERYRVEAAPITVIADREGVVRTSFVGAFGAAELWAAIAELRAG